MIAVRTFWRYTRNTLQWPRSNSVIETINPGDRCDWAAGSLYETLGYCVPCD